MQNLTKRLTVWAALVALILTVPLVLTLVGSGVDGEGWHWTLFDFVFMGALLFGSALTYELVARKIKNGTYRFAVGIAVVTALVLVWVNGAVGIIGDGSANSMYFGVIAVGFIGAAIARLEPRGMARALFATALAQALVPVIALMIGESDFAPGVWQVFGLNAFFVVMFVVSGLFFRRASATSLK